MKHSTRPPAQYIPAPGTKFRLIANEYDKNTYGQCNYASYRTLIRCKQIRSKDELAKNGGRCEEHGEFSKILERNHKKEVMRCHAENDSKMQRRRFDPWIASNEYISDEDDYLQSVRTLPIELPDAVNDNLLDDHPLRYAGFFTDKDVLKIKMDLVQKDIDDLMEFKELIINQAQKDHEILGNDDDEDLPTDLAQRRLFKASADYARNDYLTLTKVDPVFSDCCFGPDMEEQLVISHVVHSILNKIDGFVPFSAEKQCEKPAIQYSKLCMEHITLDRRQQIFKPCRLCGTTSFVSDSPLCTFHLKFPESKVSAVPQPVDKESAREETIRLDNHSSDDDDDLRLGNLSRIESMVSPMQQYSQLASPPSNQYHQPPVRRYQGTPAQILRPPQMGPPGSVKTAAQRVVANLHNYSNREMLMAQQKEDEKDSLTCARVRPIDPTQYGAGKKTAEQYRHQGNSPSPSSHFQMQQKRMMMPSIVSSGGPSLTNSPGRSTPFAGWRNPSVTTPRSIHQQHQMPPTRFPVQQHRQVPHQPKTIPLERIQEPKSADELVEDRGSPPPKYPVPEPVRRGVPYYKNASAYRRTEVPIRAPPHPSAPSTSTSSPPTASSSSSSTPYVIPPVPPTPPRPRPQSTRPMPPHRAIAAGLNPADAVTAATPRPSYQIPTLPPPPVPPPPPVALQPVRTPEKTLAPIMTMTLGVRRTPVIPSRVTTSYTVVGNRANDFSAGTSSSPDSRFNNSALDTARHDARFANMNVKTFLAIGNKDLSTMTQAEIDILAAAGSEKPKKHSAPSTPQVANTSSSAATSTPKTTPPAVPVPPLEKPEEAEKEVTARKRKIEETLETEKEVKVVEEDVVKETESVLKPESPKETTPPREEPPAKKKAEDSAEKAEKQEQPKTTPRTPSKRSTPSTSAPSGRVPRAAAIAANQAITHQKPSTSGANQTADGANPLDLLAELSEAAAAAEEALETPTKGSKKVTKRTRSSTSKKTNEESEEHEEEL